MAAAGRMRCASVDALACIEPAELASRLQGLVEEASMLPGVVTVVTAECLGEHTMSDAAIDRGVGVQLCYDGLRLTRELIRTDAQYLGDDPTHGYLDLVGAEVLVSRGFANLTDTPVAPQTIEIVRRFSRNQTLVSEDTEADGDGRSLEYDAIALAVDAGAALALESPPAMIGDVGHQLATEFDREPFPPATSIAPAIHQAMAAASGPAEDPLTAND